MELCFIFLFSFLFLSNGCIFAALLLSFVSFVNYFSFCHIFSRALLRTFGDMGRDGEKGGDSEA